MTPYYADGRATLSADDRRAALAATPWKVLSLARVIDGDSVVLTRSRTIGVADGLRIDATDTAPVRVRLVHIDTPERGEEGWSQARDDLTLWINTHAYRVGGLVLHDAGRDAFGRVLGDLQTPDGDSASLHMIRDRGWKTWMETR